MPGVLDKPPPPNDYSPSISASYRPRMELRVSSLTSADDRGAARRRHIQVRNRRLRYLEAHSSTYFANPDLELADPLLYDSCIRRFQTASEREEEGRRKGWSGILMADLERSEAKLEALRKREQNGDECEGEDEKVHNREEGIEKWKDEMTRRFLEGRDEDVDYTLVDDNEEYDDRRQMERDEEDAYFDAETPEIVEGRVSTDTGIQDF